jgi:hypothetical protein
MDHFAAKEGLASKALTPALVKGVFDELPGDQA